MKEKNSLPKCLLVVSSYHHNNTSKIAHVISDVLNAVIKTPEQVTQDELLQYDMVGFGSGIDSGKHYAPLLEFADRCTNVTNKKGFLFSTSAMQGTAKVEKDHAALRNKLTSKGYLIIGEFSCKGYNTNSILRFIGGMNKERPNEDDFMNAKEFALGLLKK